MRIIRLHGAPETRRQPKRRVEVIRRVRNPALHREGGGPELEILQLRMHDGTYFEVLTPAACARELGCSDSRVIQLVTSGRLPAHRLGRQYVILDEDLEQFVENRRKQVEKIKLDYRSLQNRSKKRG